MNVNAYMTQANEYAYNHEGIDVIYKILNTLALTHPMHTVRAAELQRWMAAGEYDRIMRGEYTRRGDEQRERPIRDDLSAAKTYYSNEAKDLAREVAGAAKRAAGAAADAFRNAQKK